MAAPVQADAQRALALAGADIGADHRHQRRAEPEHQRHQQILEPHRRAVAGDRRRTDEADEAVAVAMREIGRHR